MSLQSSVRQHAHEGSIAEVRQVAAARVRSLLHGFGDRQEWVVELREVANLLRSLPLASGEFAVAMNRLRNAEDYLRSAEIGAANYELRLLLGQL